MKTKRYMVFAGHHFYPGGGANDYKGSFDDLNLALKHLFACGEKWGHIFDTELDKIVENIVNIEK